MNFSVTLLGSMQGACGDSVDDRRFLPVILPALEVQLAVIGLQTAP